MSRSHKRKWTTKTWVTLAGDGLWGGERGQKVFLRIQLDAQQWEDDLYVRAYGFFYPNNWRMEVDGLMYTDSGVERDVQQAFKALGLKHWKEVWWSEQGMQGYNYADFDVGDNLAKELVTKGFCEPEITG